MRLSIAVREELSLRWLATQRRVANARVKRVCYLSVEYLPGRSLLNALHSLDADLVHEARVTLRDMGHELDDIAAQEVDPGLGNGGLGRLAACFLDSLATLQYPAIGYGIRYDYGIFTQVLGERRRAARNRQHLAAIAQCVGDAARQRALCGALRRPQRGAAGRASGRTASLGRHRGCLRHRLRSADSGQPQPHRQSPAALVGTRHYAVPHRGLQCG